MHMKKIGVGKIHRKTFHRKEISYKRHFRDKTCHRKTQRHLIDGHSIDREDFL